jgi:predicted N-acetyltransferase YhbS
MTHKIREILSDNAGCAYVAEDENRVIGVISFHAIPLLHAAGNLGRITALVVNTTHQRAGIGAKLVQAVEEFARDAGCVRMEVTSSEHRQGAHTFYKKAGYALSTHGRFIREL